MKSLTDTARPSAHCILPSLGRAQTAFAGSDSALSTSADPKSSSERRTGSQANVTEEQLASQSL